MWRGFSDLLKRVRSNFTLIWKIVSKWDSLLSFQWNIQWELLRKVLDLISLEFDYKAVLRRSWESSTGAKFAFGQNFHLLSKSNRTPTNPSGQEYLYSSYVEHFFKGIICWIKTDSGAIQAVVLSWKKVFPWLDDFLPGNFLQRMSLPERCCISRESAPP